MTNKRFSNWICIFLMLWTFSARAEDAPRRIQSQIVDLGQVIKVYMAVGMVTLIQIPNAVTGIRTGNPDAVQYFRPDKPENEVTLILKDANAKPTNLIIRSGKRIYVFDIIPSTTVHQDVIEIIGYYGGAGVESQGARLIDSSDKKVGLL